MNKKLLFDLFSLYGYTDKEDDVIYFVKNYLDKIGVNYSLDRYGNIYGMNYPNKPILSAHMDAVGNDIDRNLAKFVEIVNTKDGEHLIGRGNIGGDDKCGIYIILEYLTNISKEINFIFSVGEEFSRECGIPYVISTIKDNEIFKSAPYCLVLDRKGANDILCSLNKYGSVYFENQLLEIGKNYGYNINKGTYSDANILRYFMNCANLSVGYYNAHSRYEYVSLDNLQNAFNYVCDIVSNITKPVEKIEWKKNAFKKHLKWRKYSDKVPNCFYNLFKKLYF